jgi:hypothetical protein
MQSRILAFVIVWLVLLCTSCARAVTHSDSMKTEPKKEKRFVRSYVLPKNTMFFDIRKAGTIHLFSRTFVVGRVQYEEKGLRFVPSVNAPEGYPQDEFDRVYWYNAHFTDFYIPYNNIESYNRYKGLIRTKDGKKYRFASREMEELTKHIRSNLSK